MNTLPNTLAYLHLSNQHWQAPENRLNHKTPKIRKVPQIPLTIKISHYTQFARFTHFYDSNKSMKLLVSGRSPCDFGSCRNGVFWMKSVQDEERLYG